MKPLLTELEEERNRMRNALYAVLPLAAVPGTPKVVSQKLRGIVRQGLALDGHEAGELRPVKQRKGA